jgi:hypothetical protein
VRRFLSAFALAIVVLVAPCTATAQAALPVGEARGVRVVRENRAIVVIFTQRAEKLRRRIAGKRVEVECTDEHPLHGPPRAFTFIGPPHPGEIVETHGGGVTIRAPKRRRKLLTGDQTRGMDYCQVWLLKRSGRRLIVSVPLTQDGAVFLDERTRTRRLMQVLAFAGFVAGDLNLSGWPSHAQLIRAAGSDARVRLVGLETPADTPPARTIGYYSDRREHAAVVILSRSGRRLFVELADDVLSTNLAGYIFNEP